MLYMAWFFADGIIENDVYLITGEDARHIEKSLRMRKGEELTLVSEGTQYLCTVKDFLQGSVEVEVKASKPCDREASVQVTLYQSLTKGDKMDFIVQKSVELGVHRIVPVITGRCVSRPDEKSLRKKIDRWQKIALGAAQQSCRGIVPEVCDALSFEQALESSQALDCSVIFYEGGGEKLRNFTDKGYRSFGMFIGCEGGFDLSEVESARSQGVTPATMGKRILRAETAPLAALSALMCLTGNFD